MKFSGVVSKAALTKEVRTDSFKGRRHVVRAEGVKGEVMPSSESLVTCARRAAAAAPNKSNGDGESEFSTGTSTNPLGCSEDENRSQSVREVFMAESKLALVEAEPAIVQARPSRGGTTTASCVPLIDGLHQQPVRVEVLLCLQIHGLRIDI